jgi:uncharacterized membrane protein YgcG
MCLDSRIHVIVDQIVDFLKTPLPKFTVQEEQEPNVESAPLEEYNTAPLAAPGFRPIGAAAPLMFGDFHHGAYDLTSRESVHYDPAIIASSMVMEAALAAPQPSELAPMVEAQAAEYPTIEVTVEEHAVNEGVVEDFAPAPAVTAPAPESSNQEKPYRRRSSFRGGFSRGSPRGGFRGGRGRFRGGRGGAASAPGSTRSSFSKLNVPK